MPQDFSPSSDSTSSTAGVPATALGPPPHGRPRRRETVLRRAWTAALAATLVVALAVTLARPAAAQQDEPILEQVQDLFSSEGMSLGFLLQAVADPGVEDDDPARFSVGNARLRLEGALDGGFSYKLQTNHVGTSTLLDAQVGWSPNEQLVVSAGRFKTPFSREFLTYAGSTDFVSRSRVVVALAPNRQVGAQAGGQLNEMVSWSLGGFTGATNATTDESLIGVLRVEGADIEVGEGTLAVAANVAGGREDAIGARQLGAAFSGDGILYGADARYESGPLMLSGEYVRGEWEPDVGPDEIEADGLYLTAGYMVQEMRQILVRWDRFVAPNTGDGIADDLVVLGFNAWPTTATEIQVNWQIPVDDSTQLHRLLVNLQVGF